MQTAFVSTAVGHKLRSEETSIGRLIEGMALKPEGLGVIEGIGRPEASRKMLGV